MCAHTCGYVLGRRGAHFKISTIFLQASIACCSLIFPWTRLFMYKCSTKCLANAFIVETVILDVAACLSTAFQWTWVSSENRKSLLNEQNYKYVVSFIADQHSEHREQGFFTQMKQFIKGKIACQPICITIQWRQYEVDVCIRHVINISQHELSMVNQGPRTFIV